MKADCLSRVKKARLLRTHAPVDQAGSACDGVDGCERAHTRAHGRMSRISKVAVCALLAVSLVGATGCRDTDALKEIIYDQNSDLIDYDSPSKFYINDSTADEESPAVSSQEVSEEEPDTDEVQNLVVYSSEPNSEGYTAKQSLYSPFPDFIGIEASDTVYFYQSDSVDAVDHAITPTPEEDEETDEEEEEDEETSTTTQGSTSSEDSTYVTSGTTGEAGDGTTTTTEADDSGATVGDETNPVEENDGTGGLTSTEGVGETKTYTTAFDISNPDADTPQVDSVAAFGEYALIVQMIGGSGALAATDAETLADLNDAGVSQTAVEAWSDDGTDPMNMDVEAIVASGAEVILVEDPTAYTTALSTERLEYLEENGVSWVSLRGMYSSTYIKANVEVVGEMLQGSSVAEYGSQAEDRAEYYEEFHDRVIADANDGLASDTVNSSVTSKAMQLDNDTDGLGFSENDVTYTVLIDYWDKNAKLTLSTSYFDSGIAYASAGYESTPLSFYMQAGGTINNAAAVNTSKSSGEVPVLQFRSMHSSSLWTGTTLTDILYTSYALLNSGVNEQNTSLGKGLGSDAMPKVIVTSSDIKDALVASSASATSAYHAFSYTEAGLISGQLGLTYETNNGSTTVVWSCIGSDSSSGETGEANPIYSSGQIDEDDVLVNPSGYFCDWTEGTVESFLESGWIGAYVNGSYDANQWAQDVKDFYSWAWGISVSMTTIQNQ